MKKYLAILLMATSSFYACGGSGAGSNNVDISPNDSQTAPASEDSTLYFPGGVMLEIPAGALETDTEITVTALDQADGVSDARGAVIQFSPEGMQFLKPVKITIQYDASLFAGGEKPVIAFSTEDDSSLFEQIDTTDNGDGTLSALITHFSWAYVTPFSASASQCGATLVDLIGTTDTSTNRFVFGRTAFKSTEYMPMRNILVVATLASGATSSGTTDEKGCYALSYSTTDTLVAVVALPYIQLSNSTGTLFRYIAFSSYANNYAIGYDSGFYALGPVSGADQTDELAMISIDTSSEWIEQPVSEDELNLAFALMDSAWATIHFTNQVDSSVIDQLPPVTAIEHRSDESDAIELEFDTDGNSTVTISQPTTYDLTNPADVYHLGSHMMFHVLQHTVYSDRDFTILVGRFANGAVGHFNFSNAYDNGLVDARFSFYEGLAEAMAAVVMSQELGYSDLASDVPVDDDGLWRIRNNALALYDLISQYGYADVHDVLDYYWPDSPVFQTLHSFGYYYTQFESSIDTYFAGIPTESLNDLYDTDNQIGALNPSSPLYPPIAHFTAQILTERTTNPDSGQMAWLYCNKDILMYRTFFCQPLYYESTDTLGILYDYQDTGGNIIAMDENQDGWASLYLQEDIFEVYGLSDTWTDFTTNSTLYSAYHQTDSSITSSYPNPQQSRWFYANGDDFVVRQGTLHFYVDYDCDSDQTFWFSQDTGSYFDGCGDETGNAAVMVPLRIADDDSDCQNYMYMTVYRDGEIFAQREGTCADGDDALSVYLNEGEQYLVEVYTVPSAESNHNGSANCFGFMQEDFCAENYYNDGRYDFDYSTNNCLDGSCLSLTD